MNHYLKFFQIFIGPITFGPKPWVTLDLNWQIVMELVWAQKENQHLNSSILVAGSDITSLLVNILNVNQIKRYLCNPHLDESHGTGPNHPIVQKVVREMILGSEA